MVLGLTGCFNKEASDQKEKSKKLSDWIKSGKGIVCSVNTPQGEVIVKTKGEKVRMDGIMYMDMTSSDANHGTQKGSSISDGEWFYMWGDDNGIKIKIEEMEKMGAKTEDDYGVEEEDYSAEEWAKSMEEAQASYDCREENISDSEFQVPNNINFADLNEMIQDMQNVSQDMIEDNQIPEINKEDLPEIEGSTNMSQEEIEAQLEEIMGN